MSAPTAKCMSGRSRTCPSTSAGLLPRPVAAQPLFLLRLVKLELDDALHMPCGHRRCPALHVGIESLPVDRMAARFDMHHAFLEADIVLAGQLKRAARSAPPAARYRARIFRRQM